MGIPCFQEDKPTKDQTKNYTKDYGFDLEELYQKADEDFRSSDIIGESQSLYNEYVNNKSFEEIDKEIKKYEKLLSKLKKIEINDENEYKVEMSKIYVEKKLNALNILRKGKNQINILKEENQKFETFLENIRKLFPKNYFLQKTKRENDIHPNWVNLPYNILGKYDNGNDSWLEDDNEWINAYHGTGRNCRTEQEIFGVINSIKHNGFRNEYNNYHADHNDIHHKGETVGIGVYVTPNIETAKSYAGKITLNGEERKTLFLVKVKKDAIRACNCPGAKDFWVVNGSDDEIRPVEVLYEAV